MKSNVRGDIFDLISVYYNEYYFWGFSRSVDYIKYEL
jgi:hypothetical protein